MNRRRYDPSFDEALLEHYDEIGLHKEYRTVLERIRRNGHEPQGPGAPLPDSHYYRDDNQRRGRP